MKQAIVVACFGDARSMERVAELSATSEVIAVAFDFGGQVSLGDMRTAALSAGAVRCHAFDVREDYAHDLVQSATRPDVCHADHDAATRAARNVIARKLEEIASFEHAVVVEPEHVPVPRRRETAPVPRPVHLVIRFEGGVPVAVNGVDMSPAEVIESLETITGESALTVLHRYVQAAPGLQIA